MNWLDFILLFLAVWLFFTGAKKGLLMQAGQLLSVVVSFFIAARWGKVVGNWLAAVFPIGSFLERRLTATAPEAIFHEKIIPDELAALQQETVGMWMSTTFLTLIGFILVFIISLVIFTNLCRLLKVVNFLPLLGPVNAVGGGFLGLAKGGFSLFILLALISLFESEPLANVLRGSAIISLLGYFFDWFYSLVVTYLIGSLNTDFSL